MSTFGTYGVFSRGNERVHQDSPCAVCKRPYESGYPQLAYECNNPSCGLKVHSACMSKWVVEQGKTVCPYCGERVSREDLELVRSSTDSRVVRLEQSTARIETQLKVLTNYIMSK